MTIYYEDTPYIAELPNDGAAWFLCLDHAKQFATDNGLEWSGDYGYTEYAETKGATVWADTFGQVELDYPQGCEGCDLDRAQDRTTWLGVRLTDEGARALLEPTNSYPLAVVEFYGFTAADIEKEQSYYVVQWPDTGNQSYLYADSALDAIREAKATYHAEDAATLGAPAVRRAVLNEWKRELTISGNII